MRFFNTAGPVNLVDHYCLPPLGRLNLEDILSMIDQKKYFVLHAPRQTGKTTCLKALMDYLNSEGRYRALYINVESAQGARENVLAGMAAIYHEFAGNAEYYLGDNSWRLDDAEVRQRYGREVVAGAFSAWAVANDLPTVLLLDEIDSLIGDMLISMLRQLRAGYNKRPDYFPQSVVLCGVRDVRDYRIHSDSEKAIITGGSAFNIKAESLRLGDFNREEMYILLNEHTNETSQKFEKGAASLIWEFTQGQPWLVNALAYEVCFRIKKGRDRKNPIQPDMIIQARENLIERRETHLDQLVDKLVEERVRSVIEPVLSGKSVMQPAKPDDIEYVKDLGLIHIARNGELTIANPIYKEIIPRELSWNVQTAIAQKASWYVLPNGKLNMKKLLSDFQEFFRENSEHWIERFQYKEAGPQLLLQAFLQRIVNSGGRIEREYALGRMRTDLLIFWPTGAEKTDKSDAEIGRIHLQTIVVELKILYKKLEKTIADGLSQTFEYMARCNADEGHLVIFDRDKQKSWDEKIFMRELAIKDRKIQVWGV